MVGWSFRRRIVSLRAKQGSVLRLRGLMVVVTGTVRKQVTRRLHHSQGVTAKRRWLSWKLGSGGCRERVKLVAHRRVWNGWTTYAALGVQIVDPAPILSGIRPMTLTLLRG